MIESAAQWIAIDKLTPWADNPRINEHAVDEVARSIQRFGFASPIIARTENKEVIAGHTRLQAAIKWGLDRVPVRFMDLDPADARMLALADNKVAELADWDDTALTAILRELDADGLDLDGLGWTADELTDLLAPDPLESDGTEDDEVAPQEAVHSKPGEVYELGDHRLICGDCTDPTVCATVLSGSRPDLILTDPPYGIGISNNPVRQKHDRSDWDDRPADSETIRRFVDSAPAAIVWGGNYFDLPVAQCFYVWDKKQPEDFTLGMCEMAWTNIGGPAKMFRQSVTSYAKDHPTQKPVALMAWCIGKADGLIFDPYLGSGTTLIAAAQSRRVCYGVERSPAYCDVIRRRWTAFANSHGIDPGSGALA